VTKSGYRRDGGSRGNGGRSGYGRDRATVATWSRSRRTMTGARPDDISKLLQCPVHHSLVGRLDLSEQAEELECVHGQAS
jgi:hypothetical protein